MKEMSEKKKKTIHIAISVTISLILVAVGALFIAQCIGIYNSGDRPFTRESVSTAFKKILIPTLVFVVVTLAGALISILLPLKEKKKAGKNPHFTQIRLAKLCDEKKLTNTELSEIRRERNMRYIILGGGIILFIISFIYPAFYVFTPNRFGTAGPEAINSEFIRAVSVLLLCLTPLSLYTLFGIFAFRASYQREIEVLKTGTARIAKENKASEKNIDKSLPICCENADVIVKNTIPVSKKLIFILQIILICAAAALIILGINNGGAMDVLEKAKKVCSECIGLG